MKLKIIIFKIFLINGNFKYNMNFVSVLILFSLAIFLNGVEIEIDFSLKTNELKFDIDDKFKKTI